MGEQAVDDLDRLLGVVDRDVDVHAEDQLASGDVLELVDERAVAVACRDPLALEEAERVRPGRADAQARLAGDLRHGAAQLAQLAVDVGDVPADRRRDLEHRLHQLGADDVLEMTALDRGQHRVDVLDEVERGCVEEHVLLLHAERVRIALAEAVLVHAAVRGQPLARDAGRNDAVHAGMLRHDRSRPTSCNKAHERPYSLRADGLEGGMRSRLLVTASAAALLGGLTLSAAALGGSTPSSSQVVVKTAFNKKLKKTILVDGRGLTLYLFASDIGGKATCIDDSAYHCVRVWPPLRAKTVPRAGAGAKQSLLGLVKRPDGGKQVTYNHHPLYYFRGGATN